MSLLSRYQSMGESVDPSFRTRQAIRINALKRSEHSLVKDLKSKGVVLEKIPFAPGYWAQAEFSLGATPEYLQGFYYLQEAASQLPPLVLDPRPDEIVLDMAAAPGSKTTQMSEMMENSGVIVALDADAHRLASLRNNLERLGISNAVLYKKDARFCSDLGVMFDKILLDAPCSGNYCIEEQFFSIRTVENFRQKAKVQKELLKSAYKVLKKGGTLVYSTCSLEPEEDELVIDWLLGKYDDLSLADTGLAVGDSGLVEVFGQSLRKELALCRRLWPHKSSTQGFFIAKVVKR